MRQAFKVPILLIIVIRITAFQLVTKRTKRMMKFDLKYCRHCFLAFAFVSVAVKVCFAQIEFTEHTIAGDFVGAWSVYAVDIDSDDDMDVLGAAANDDDVTCWESDLDPELWWRALPDSGFFENGSLDLSLEYLYEHIFSLQFPDSVLVISDEDGEYLLGEANDEG